MKNILAASSTSSRLPVMEYGEHPLNELELRSVNAIITYIAHTQDASDVTVSALAAAKFGADDVTNLRQRDYDDVIRFLVDLNIRETLN